MEAASHSDPLVILIDLEKRTRSVSELNELKFVFVNETHGLFHTARLYCFRPKASL